ncbi:15705_t:CDS:2 [Entrophospora sp. SA101]|nr:15705_t:CDS:2 [Entrophospora sp. SA101]
MPRMDNHIVETVQDNFEEESSQLEHLIDKLPFDDPIMAIDYITIDNEVVEEETVMEDEEIIATVTLTSNNALIQYKLRPAPINKIPPENKSKIKCYYFLNKTSRSFAAVIQELDDELRDAICLFYLALRGLDTIEDDMTIPITKKEPLLRNFHEILFQRGWNFTENGPNEKDRELLVEYDVFIEEFLKLDKKFQDIISDITKKMGNGMADYAKNAAHEQYGVMSIKDFDLYCHYVAGLVGLGLNGLFVASGLESPELAKNSDLANIMGLFLQKVNITRDYLDDLLENRKFWPKEIWSQYVNDLSDLKEPGYETRAINCLSTMIHNSLEHVPQCLTYMSQIKNQSVFTFCAIPQVMAIATLALLFRNYNVYKGVVKIRKATNIYEVANIFIEFTKVIIQKNNSKDPNFMKISVACSQIKQWCHTNLPDLDKYNSGTLSSQLKPKDSQNDNDLLIFFSFLLLAFTAYLLYYCKEYFYYDGLEILDLFYSS